MTYPEVPNDGHVFSKYTFTLKDGSRAFLIYPDPLKEDVTLGDLIIIQRVLESILETRGKRWPGR